MRRRRRTKMTIETSEVYVVRRPGGSAESWCPHCAQRVAMVGAEEASALAGVSSRTIYRWIEEERIHFVETPGKGLLVCLNSLSKAGRN